MWIADKIYFQGSSAFTRAYQGSELVWDKNYYIPLIFTAKANNSSVGLARKSTYQTVEYSTDGGNAWTNMTTTTTINLSSGDTVYIRGTLSSNNTTLNYTNFKMTGNIKASGNINYLWNYNNPDAALKNYCGYFMFYNCTSLTDASELILPSTSLTDYCYYGMFAGCRSLTTTPSLPATTLANNCYHNMFSGCISLTTAPSVLPATTLTDSCYRSMFQNCSGLTKVPDLPATGLANNCYHQFAQNTAIQRAPELPATTLVTECYYRMFSGCTNLNYIKCLATNISASNCTYNWVENVSGSGTFVKDENMTGWQINSVNGIPIGWTPLENVEYWWTASNTNTTHFDLPTLLGDDSYASRKNILEIDYVCPAFVRQGQGLNTDYPIIESQGDFPLAFGVYGSSASPRPNGYYLNEYLPNSTTNPTVDTTYNRSMVNGHIYKTIGETLYFPRNIKLTAQIFQLGVKINSRLTEIVDGHTFNAGYEWYNVDNTTFDRDLCNDKNYTMHVYAGKGITTAVTSDNCYVGDIRVYYSSSSGRTLKHDYRLYPYNGSYVYYDMVTDTWYPVVNGEISKVQTTNR